MGERPIGLGKVAENGTLNENGAFYSVQDINVLLEEKGGSSGGGDLPTPTVADAGSVVVVDNEGKYALGAAGGGGLIVHINSTAADTYVLDKNYSEIKSTILTGVMPVFIETVGTDSTIYQLTACNDADSDVPYIVAVYKVTSDGVEPSLTPLVFVSDSETGVLTATTE